jgi:hypothetical protein
MLIKRPLNGFLKVTLVMSNVDIFRYRLILFVAYIIATNCVQQQMSMFVSFVSGYERYPSTVQERKFSKCFLFLLLLFCRCPFFLPAYYFCCDRNRRLLIFINNLLYSLIYTYIHHTHVLLKRTTSAI